MGPNEGDIVKVFALIFFLAGIVATLVYLSHRHNKKQEKLEDDRQKGIDHGVEKGICDENGVPLCAICKQLGDDVEATEFTPVTGKSWWDSIKFVSRMRRLWAQADRDIVVDDEGRGKRLCRSHKTMCVRKLNEVHEACRSQTMSLNNQLRERIEFADNGGTEAAVLNTTLSFKKSLGVEFEDAISVLSHPQLESSTESFSLPVRNSSEPEEESDDES